MTRCYPHERRRRPRRPHPHDPRPAGARPGAGVADRRRVPRRLRGLGRLVGAGRHGAGRGAISLAINAAARIALFTVSHEAAHNTISPRPAVNTWFGRFATPMFAPHAGFRTWRFIHMQHHRFTNDTDGEDPDHFTMAGPGWQRPLRWITVDLYYLSSTCRGSPSGRGGSGSSWRSLRRSSSRSTSPRRHRALSSTPGSSSSRAARHPLARVGIRLPAPQRSARDAHRGPLKDDPKPRRPGAADHPAAALPELPPGPPSASAHPLLPLHRGVAAQRGRLSAGRPGLSTVGGRGLTGGVPADARAASSIDARAAGAACGGSVNVAD